MNSKIRILLVVGSISIGMNAYAHSNQRPTCNESVKCLKRVSSCLGGAFSYRWVRSIICITCNGQKVEYETEDSDSWTHPLGDNSACRDARSILLQTYDVCEPK